MKWWQRKLRALKLRWARGSGPLPLTPSPRGRGGARQGRGELYRSPVGTFVHYSTVMNVVMRQPAMVQQVVVVDREGLKQSEYRLWLN